jgi:hypothetical protein
LEPEGAGTIGLEAGMSRRPASPWIGLHDWWEQLEVRDLVLLALAAAVGIGAMTPWRREWVQEAKVRPHEGELQVLLAPGQGVVTALAAQVGMVLGPGEVLYGYRPLPESPGPAVNVATSSSLFFNASWAEEKKIRDRYSALTAEAYTYLKSSQDQLNRVYRDQRPGRRDPNSANDVQLALNALARAREVPEELRRKMEQEINVLRRERESFSRSSQAAVVQRSSTSEGAGGEISVRVSERVLVSSLFIQRGSPVSAEQECAALLPESALLEIAAAVPTAFAGELRAGAVATLEVQAWMRDSEKVPLRLVGVGNRNLDPAEVADLVARPAGDASYVLATFEAVSADGKLFPPPGTCRIQLVGARRALLQRLLK